MEQREECPVQAFGLGQTQGVEDFINERIAQSFDICVYFGSYLSLTQDVSFQSWLYSR